MEIANYLHMQELISEDAFKIKELEARFSYFRADHLPPNPFPPASQLQRFFGIREKELYRYADKLHPNPLLRKGYEFPEFEDGHLQEADLLIKWWQKQEKKASYFSSTLTKKLFKVIETVELNEADSLKKLFQEADKWLILKENSSSSRYAQVESLRGHIYNRLVNTYEILKSDLAKINRENLKETRYFLNHWTRASRAASYFKTEATIALEQAFAAHAERAVNKNSDETLLKALDLWLDQKKDSKSKRYDLVIQMREHLQEVIENTYPDPGLEMEAKLHS